MIYYFLFGSIPVRQFTDGDPVSASEGILTEFNTETDNPIELLDISAGYENYAVLTKEQYDQLCPVFGIEVANAGPQFPNGFPSWHETHFEITGWLLDKRRIQNSLSNRTVMTAGFNGLKDLAKDLTNEFETLHKGEQWIDKDWYDEIDEFLKKKDIGE